MKRKPRNSHAGIFADGVGLEILFKVWLLVWFLLVHIGRLS